MYLVFSFVTGQNPSKLMAIAFIVYTQLTTCVYSISKWYVHTCMYCQCFFVHRELGTVPPQADLKQEAIILMQTKRIDILKQKLDQMEQEKSFALAAGM